MKVPFAQTARLMLAGLALAGLVGCSSLRDTFGLNKSAPDEFTVVTKAPLVLPPDFALRPPEKDGRSPQVMPPQERAELAVTGSTGLAPVKPDAGELALLKQAGADKANPDIRELVNSEFSQLAERDKSFTDKLIFWHKAVPPGTVIDPEKEAQRLRQNAATGQSPLAGETPIITHRKRGLLEGIF